MSKVTQPDGGEVNSTYWPTGELKRTWGSRTYPVEYTYDDQGRMKTLTTWQDFAGDSGRAVTTWNYEPATGRLQQKLYDDGKGPSYTYSAAGRLHTRTWARKVNGQDLVTSYAYTAAGDLETVDYSNTPGPLKDVVYGYDRLGRQTSIGDSTGTRTTSYTDAGQPDAVTWQDGLLAGMTLDYSQDALLRATGYTLTRAAQPQLETVATASYGYDAAGRLGTVTSGTDVFSYGYLQNSSLVDTVTSRHGATEVMKTVKTWDNLNRLTAIENRNGADLPARVYSSHVYTYNSANQRTEALREDATKWAYGYDALGQVTSGVKKKADGTPLPGLSFGYLFDDIGNRREATTSVGGALRAATYSANLLNQYSQRTVPGFIDLLGEAAPDATVTVNNQPTVRDGALFFKSLAVNNAASAVSQDVHVVGVKNDVGPLGEDAVTEVQGKRFVPQTPEGFTYDDDGNLQSDGRWSYEWDAENRLVAMETLPGLPASVTRQRLEFAYDSQSRRVAKKVFHWSTDHWSLITDHRFAYDGWNLIAEFSFDVQSSTFSVLRSHVWGLDLSGSQQGAGGVGGLLSSYSSSSSSSLYYCYDGNGNVVALVDAASGADTARYECDPFGNVVLQTGTAASDNVFRFSTKYHDSETGLHYYGYRYYAPGIGRWASRDPIEEGGGINVYCFVGNKPVTDTDVWGLKILCRCLDTWLQSKGVGDYVKSGLSGYRIDNHQPDLEPGTFGGTLRAMLESESVFAVDGWRDGGSTAEANLETHINARVKILDAMDHIHATYREAGHGQGPIVLNSDWWQADNSVAFGRKASYAIQDIWNGSQQYFMSCTAIVRAVMLKGILDTIGRTAFDEQFRAAHRRIGPGGETYLMRRTVSPRAATHDWVPGDWGTVRTAGGDPWNIIFLGDELFWWPDGRAPGYLRTSTPDTIRFYPQVGIEQIH